MLISIRAMVTGLAISLVVCSGGVIGVISYFNGRRALNDVEATCTRSLTKCFTYGSESLSNTVEGLMSVEMKRYGLQLMDRYGTAVTSATTLVQFMQKRGSDVPLYALAAPTMYALMSDLPDITTFGLQYRSSSSYYLYYFPSYARLVATYLLPNPAIWASIGPRGDIPSAPCNLTAIRSGGVSGPCPAPRLPSLLLEALQPCMESSAPAGEWTVINAGPILALAFVYPFTHGHTDAAFFIAYDLSAVSAYITYLSAISTLDSNSSRFFVVNLDPSGPYHEVLFGASHGNVWTGEGLARTLIITENSTDTLISHFGADQAYNYTLWASGGETYWVKREELAFTGLSLHGILLVSVAETLSDVLEATARTYLKLEDEYKATLGELEGSMLAMSLVSCGVIALLMVVSVVAAGRMVTPFVTLNNSMKEVAKMRLEEVGEHKQSFLKEINEMQESFAVMVASLFQFRSYVDHAALVDDEESSLGTHDGQATLLFLPEQRTQITEAECQRDARRCSVYSDAWGAFSLSPSSNPLISPHRTKMRERPSTVLSVAAVMPPDCLITGVSNDFVTAALTALRMHSGVVLSFTADELIGTYNSYVTCPRHWLDAIYTYQKLTAFMEDMHTKWHCAISSGTLQVGVVGDRETRTHTCYGAAVKQNKSLLRLCKILRARVLLSQSTKDRLSDSSIVTRPVDIVKIGPAGTPEYVYEIVERQRMACSEYLEVFDAFRINNKPREKLEAYMSSRPRDVQCERLAVIVASPAYAAVPVPYYRLSGGEWVDFEEGPVGVPWWGGTLDCTLDTLPCSRTGKAGRAYSCESIEREIQAAVGSATGGPVPATVTDRTGEIYHRSGKLLGKGRYGEVWSGMDAGGGFVALKALPLPARRRPLRRQRGGHSLESEIRRLINEVQILKLLKHENIVAYLGSAVTDAHLVVLMEYLPGGSLLDVVRSYEKLPPSCIRRFLKDILRGLIYLHKAMVIHRDVKPENILLMNDGQCKLSDFGVSYRFADSTEASQVIGTPLYMAPEVCLGEANTASDIWSLGVTVYYCITGLLPYPSAFLSLPVHAVIYQMGNTDVQPELAETVPIEFRLLIERCLQRDHRMRPTAEVLYGQPLVNWEVSETPR